MKKAITILICAFVCLSLAACSSDTSSDNQAEQSAAASETPQPEETESAAQASSSAQITETAEANSSNTAGEEQKRTAKDDANMQTDDPDMPTRVLEDGTKINMHFGDAVIPGILNDSDTAQALIELLPYTVRMNSYSHDFCGVMPDDLPYNEDEVHYGWLNGDIDYAVDAPYFTILYSDEDISEQYGYQVNIGVIDCDLAKIRDLSGSYDVLIELAE